MTIAFRFQASELDANWSRPAWGLNWDMGVGKTFVAIENARRLEAARLISGMVVCAPNGVHRNWSTDELPRHGSPGWITFTWFTSRAKTKKHEAALAAFLADPAVFKVLVVSYDGLMTEDCAKAVKKFMQSRPCMLVVDESQFVKSPDSQRTKRVIAMSAYAPYRRILTGTIVDDKPFDVYSQIKILDREAWHGIGCGSYQAFKAQFGVWEQRRNAGRLYPELVSYRNIEQMQAVVARWTTRVRKSEVLSDLPPKLYSTRYFDLSPEQARVYRDLRDEAMSLLAGGELVTAPLVITRLLRMQQVASGYMPLDQPDEDGERPLTNVGDSNPRLRCLLETVGDLPHQAIVWAKFTEDVRLICDALAREGLTCARYDGSRDDEQCADAVARFRDGSAQFFVSNPAKGGTGLTLVEAKTMVFYNTTYRLGQRLQAEDRAHRIGQDQRLAVTDLVGMLSADEPTIDLGILRALQRKREMACQVSGDEIRSWLFPSAA